MKIKVIFLCAVLAPFSSLIAMGMQDYDFSQTSSPIGYFRTILSEDGCLNSKKAKITIIPVPGKVFCGFGYSTNQPSDHEKGITFQLDEIFFKVETKVISLAALISYLEDERSGKKPKNEAIETAIFTFFKDEKHHTLKNRQLLWGLTYSSIWQLSTKKGSFVPLFIARDDL